MGKKKVTRTRTAKKKTKAKAMARKTSTKKTTGKVLATPKAKNDWIHKTLRQKQVIEKYAQALVERNTQAEALRIAVPAARRWKDHTVHCRASELAKTEEVLGRVKELSNRQLEEHNITLDAAMQFLWSVVQLDAGVFFDKDGNEIPVYKLPKAIRLLVDKDGKVAVGKSDALQQLRNYFAFWKGFEGGTGYGIPFVPAGEDGEGRPVTIDARSIHFHEIPPKEAARVYQQLMNGDFG